MTTALTPEQRIEALEAELAARWREADKRGADTIKALADGYAGKVANFARALALKQKDDSMSPLAVEAGDARMELHAAIDAALAAQEKA